ncbi:unnamed protein product [Camellia sinensis]
MSCDFCCCAAACDLVMLDSRKYTGIVEDCCCDYETIDNFNGEVLHPLLQEQLKLHFFDISRYEPLSYFFGREYFIHAYDPIYALSTDGVSSLVALRREASEDEIQVTMNFLI